MHYVFVYGTLKRGFPNHHLMPEAEFTGTARTSDRIPLVVAGRWFGDQRGESNSAFGRKG